jgi:hypothetical protein
MGNQEGRSEERKKERKEIQKEDRTYEGKKARKNILEAQASKEKRGNHKNLIFACSTCSSTLLSASYKTEYLVERKAKERMKKGERRKGQTKEYTRLDEGGKSILM